MNRVTSMLLCTLSLAPVGCGDGGTAPIVPDAVRLPAVADTLAWGESARLRASYEVAGAAMPSDDALRWTSTEPQYFSIDSLTGEGQAHETFDLVVHTVGVIARSHGVADTTTVIVIPPITTLRLIVSSSVATGRSFAPVLRAQAGNAPFVKEYTPPPESGTPVLRSSNPDVIAVGADGRLTARAAGLAWVVATLRGVSDSMQVRVGTAYAIVLVPNSGGMTPSAVNDARQVAASQSSPGAGTYPAALFDGAAVVSLGTCDPRAMNNAGEVVCRDGRVFSNGSFRPAPSGQSNLSASGITESGSAFGRHSAGLTTEAILWDATGTVVPLPASSCCGFLRSTGKVNALGHGVGTTSELYSHPLLMRGSVGTALNAPGGRYADAFGINDADDVVGSSENQLGSGTAAIWRAADQWSGRLLGSRTVAATGIAEDGLVVGTGLDGAFVWRDDRYALLGDLVAGDGWFITAPTISRQGIIAAQGVHTSGKSGIVLITPTGAP
jgi:hypothetical protein